MKTLTYIAILLLFLSSCNLGTDLSQHNRRFDIVQPSKGGISVKATYCLQDLLNGNPTGGGTWTLVSVPTGSSITQADLVGDNPCIDFTNEPCPFDYVFTYTVGPEECPDCQKEATLTICLTCCELDINITCQPNTI